MLTAGGCTMSIKLGLSAGEESEENVLMVISNAATVSYICAQSKLLNDANDTEAIKWQGISTRRSGS
jgi:hypothetical protein